uniref:Uncharacterized protein n=1 Tax=Rhizophora mucronata TaxID=61149 RepID=A0A2P2QXJ6_RHIMU
MADNSIPEVPMMGIIYLLILIIQSSIQFLQRSV